MVGFLDVCRFTATAGGTTDWTASSAVTGYQAPSAAGAVNGTVYRYRAESSDLSQWEVGYGAYNSGTSTIARTTVLFNSSGTTSKINFSAAPQVAVVLLAEDLAPLQFTNAILQTSPGNPTGTNSAAALMMGLGSSCTLTPVYSTRIRFLFTGSATSATGSVNALVTPRYGTGTAPTNGTASAGTSVGSTVTCTIAGANFSTPFAAGGIITGLTVGTAYWFDLSLSTGSGSVVSISAPNFTGTEF